MAALSRNAQVLRFLLEEAPGVGHTKLAKYAYLADLEAIRHTGHQISEMRYSFYHHGPFDAVRFFAAKDELLNGGFATDEIVLYGPYPGHCLQPTPVAVEYSFDRSEVEVLRYVVQSYLSHNAKDLCNEIVYQTEPMVGAERDQELDMFKVRPNDDDVLGFRVERMLAGEASAKSGVGIPLSDAKDELHRRLHTRGA